MKIKNFLPALLAGAAILSAQAENLVLLHTNDTHSQLDPFTDDGLGGIARRKVLIDSVRNANENVVLIDAGDIVQGTLFFNLYKGEVEEKLMNALGYDLRILGNHEFDNGQAELAKNLATSNAELLSANYDFRDTPIAGMFKPYTIKEIDGKRIAFMGINLKPQGMISPANIGDMKYLDAAEAANGLAWYLKNIEHADLVIAITHIGHDDDVELIKNSHDIDVLIGGHSHTKVDPANTKKPYLIKNADGKDVVVAQAGKGGKYLGEITIDLDDLSKTADYKLITVDSRLDQRVDPAIEEIISPYRDAVEALYTTKVAKTAKFLDKGSDALLNLAADIVEWRGKQLAGTVDLSIMNKGGLRNSIEKGDITEGQIIQLMPFFNRVMVIEVPGDSLIEAFNTMAKAGGNGVSSNVSATYDPKTGVCEEVLISGQPIDPNKTYRIATIDYLANGGDYMHSLTDHKTIATSEQFCFEDMLDYYRKGPGKGKTINPKEYKRMKSK